MYILIGKIIAIIVTIIYTYGVYYALKYKELPDSIDVEDIVGDIVEYFEDNGDNLTVRITSAILITLLLACAFVLLITVTVVAWPLYIVVFVLYLTLNNMKKS